MGLSRSFPGEDIFKKDSERKKSHKREERREKDSLQELRNQGGEHHKQKARPSSVVTLFSFRLGDACQYVPGYTHKQVFGLYFYSAILRITMFLIPRL